MPACLTALLLLAPTAGVEVLVRDAAGVARPGAVVRGGVPFGRGELPAGTAVTVTAGNQARPTASRPLAKWYDGSVKWLLVDTLVDLPASGRVALRVVPGRADPPANAIEVSETPAGLTVANGVGRWTFRRDAFAGPARVERLVGGQWIVAAAAEASLAAEVEHTPPGPPDEENWQRQAAGGPRERFAPGVAGEPALAVEHADPLRVVVRQTGWLVNAAGRRLLRYSLRSYLTAGRPELRLVVNLVYAGRPKEDFLRSLALTFPRQTAGAARWAVGGERPHQGEFTAVGTPVDLAAIGPAKLYHLAPFTQDKAVRYRITQDGRELAAGAEPAGWGQVRDAAGSLTVGLRDYARLNPKQTRVAPDAVTCYLWPEAGNQVLDLRRRSDEIDNVYHYDLSLWEYGGEGVGLTNELSVQYDAPEADPVARLQADLNDPLRLECPPAQYAATRVLGPLTPADPQRYPRLEGYNTVGVEWIRRNQQAFRWDGQIDYGDTLFLGYEAPTHYGYQAPQSWGSRGYAGWLCNDGTLTHSLFLQALRTGDALQFRLAEAMCRHVTEVDTCHWCAANPRYVGGGHRHDQQHWGNGVRGYGTATHGAIDYYCLTGDERTLDVIGEYTQLHLDGDGGENEDRIGGLIRAWELTGDAKLKQAADGLVAAELNVAADRRWPFVTDQHFRFVSNTSASLLAYLECAPPADTKALQAAVLRAMDFREPVFTSSWQDAGYLPITLNAQAYLATGERRYLNMLLGLLQRTAVPPKVAVAPDLLDQLRTSDFGQVVEIARAWGVNNVYILGIHQLCSFPYAIAALQQAGLDETAVWSYKRVQNAAEPFEEVIPPGRIGPEFGFAFTITMEHGAPSDVAGGFSELVLLENGQPLGPAHAPHVDIRKIGLGRYSHWGSTRVWFSASDNTDPRTNGREYKVVYRPKGQ
ncbi:MAG: hypothetical protein IT204_15710 [Fimbriimonadaceae bacterium]|nr:hypothetical protein [Fimbriimonadaceae bacterium]